MKTLAAAFLFCLLFCCIFWMFSGCKEEEKNTAPMAGFEVTPATGTLETVFSFDASTCTDEQEEQSTLKVRWDWETDGIFDTDLSTQKMVTHQFTVMGTHQVTLEVIDMEGLGNALTVPVIVGGEVPEVATDTLHSIGVNEAVCGGEVLSDHMVPVTARGVCWGTAPMPTIENAHSNNGDGTGKFNASLSGLLKNTTYYVRAYATNEIGTGYGEERQFTTLNLWVCGEPISVSHVAGEVAPVSKNTVYGTVGNVAGTESLCWITSNLGADHQALAVDDATEASAGWYWQFNRKQGYQYDGGVQIPAGVWEDNIVEYSDWQLQNDPCALELGTGWRIPLQSEWVDTEQWENWTGAWESPLKLHAAGFFDAENVFHDRGVQGVYWSTLQGADHTAWYMRFKSTQSLCSANEKEYTIPLRCVKQ